MSALLHVGAIVALTLAIAIHVAPTTVFDPVVLQTIAKAAIAKHSADGNATNVVDGVIAALRVRYPKHIMDTDEWMFNNAGGAMGSMIVLHASFSEYVIIFGTAIGTEGHTGRFFADDYFTILYGEQWAHTAGRLQKEVYLPGDQHHLRWGTAKQYKMPDECWALEYARGNIPSMLPFGLVDVLSSTLDVVSFLQTVRVSARGMLGEFLVNGKI